MAAGHQGGRIRNRIMKRMARAMVASLAYRLRLALLLGIPINLKN